MLRAIQTITQRAQVYQEEIFHTSTGFRVAIKTHYSNRRKHLQTSLWDSVYSSRAEATDLAMDQRPGNLQLPITRRKL